MADHSAHEVDWFGNSAGIVNAVWESDFVVLVQLTTLSDATPAASNPEAYLVTPEVGSTGIGVSVISVAEAHDVGPEWRRLTVSLATNGQGYEIFFDPTVI